MNGALGENLAPGRNDQAMAESLASVLVTPALGVGEDVALRLNGAGLEERVPVGLSGDSREGGGNGQEGGSGLGKRPI